MDSIQGVCLLLEEDLEITFAHRSFQEYFVARFIHAARPELKARLIERYKPRSRSESVMKLLYEMDPDAVIEHYLISDIRKLKERTGVKRVVEKTHKLRFLKVWYEWFEITNEPEGSILIGMGKDQELDALVEFVTEIIGPIDDRREEKQYKENVEANMQSKFRQSYNDEEVSSSRFKKEDEFVEYVIAEELFNVYLLGEILKFGDTLIEGQKEAAASLESVLALNAL